jgi:hypothetical protein
MQLTYNFTDFSAQAYLQEYYSELTAENKFLLSFYHEFYQTTDPNLSVLELGGGPTIFLDISAAKQGHEIVFSEFAPSCRTEVIKFLIDDQNAWNWNSYLQYVVDSYAKTGATCSINELKHLLRTRIKAVIPCDLTHSEPLKPAWYQPFDIVSIGSVADTVGANEEEFTGIMKNGLGMLKPGGLFIGYFAKNCRKWTNLNKVYTTFPVNEDYVRNFFSKIKMEITMLTNSVPPDYQQDYEGIFGVTARKKG